MSHTSGEKKKLLVRVNRIQGQLQSIRKAIEEDAACENVLQQIAACRGAVNSLLVEIVEGEIRFTFWMAAPRLIPSRRKPRTILSRYCIAISSDSLVFGRRFGK